MRVRKLLTLAAVVAAFAAVASPANAVFYGEPDGNAHPYVGLMVAMDANNTPLWRCTGTQISPTVFLTAGHCVFGAAKAMVWFDSGRPAGYPRTGGFLGTPIPNPGYDEFATFPNTSDVGVVKFSTPISMPMYGTLTGPNTLEELAKHEIFDIVGYGLQDVQPVEVATVQRVKGQVKLVNAKSGASGGYSLHLSNNNGQPHQGGLCFGDSGGPVLKGSTVYAVNSFVINNNCAGSGYSFRVDLPAINSWIRSQ